MTKSTGPKDRFTRRARKEGYRARSVYKLFSLNARHRIIRRGSTVLDLGAAPGSWMEAARKMGAGRIVGVDLEPIREMEGATFLRGDVTEEEMLRRIEAMGLAFDVVLSDLAPNTTGIKHVDQARSTGLSEAALEIATRSLRPGGDFVCKIFQGPDTNRFLQQVRRRFRFVKTTKPEASKKRSKEIYVVAKGLQMDERTISSEPEKGSEVG